MKFCTKCAVRKPAAEFYYRKLSRDKRSPVCAVCSRKSNAEWRKDNQEYDTARKEKWRKDNQPHVSKQAAKKRAKNPDKLRATDAVYRAIKRGELLEPNRFPCEECQCVDRRRYYHHHAGYEKQYWLHVTALCMPCLRKEQERGCSVRTIVAG